MEFIKVPIRNTHPKYIVCQFSIMTMIRSSPTTNSKGHHVSDLWKRPVPLVRFWMLIRFFLSSTFVVFLTFVCSPFDISNIEVLKPITFYGSFAQQTLTSRGCLRSTTRRFLFKDDAAIAILMKRGFVTMKGSKRTTVRFKNCRPSPNWSLNSTPATPSALNFWGAILGFRVKIDGSHCLPSYLDIVGSFDGKNDGAGSRCLCGGKESITGKLHDLTESISRIIVGQRIGVQIFWRYHLETTTPARVPRRRFGAQRL